MQTAQPSVFARDDTFFGVCEALGEDLGFNANILRVGFAVGVFLSPVGAAAAYVGAGLVVAMTRLIVRNPRIAAAEPMISVDAAAQAAELPDPAQDNDNARSGDLAVAA